MAEVTIVGAGLAGLTAAVNLARRGYEVKVLEREERVGGSGLYHPSGQGSPLRLKELGSYIGIDLSEVLEPIQVTLEVAGGKVMEIVPSLISSHFFERGPRASSIESYLYGIAVEEGVEFEFGRALNSQGDFAQLPPNTIVATGLYFEGFDALRVPYLTSHHFTYKGTCDLDLNFVHMFHDTFTSDYGYTSAFRGIYYAHLFNRIQPISTAERDRFAEQVASLDGKEIPSWNEFTFPVPAASIRNPRLFVGNKILAGTLAGAMDPVAFFGLHGALVSGKIAAMAIEDREAAWREFRKCVYIFPISYIVSRILEIQPRRLNVLGYRIALRDFEKRKLTQKLLVAGMPGYRCIAR